MPDTLAALQSIGDNGLAAPPPISPPTGVPHIDQADATVGRPEWFDDSRPVHQRADSVLQTNVAAGKDWENATRQLKQIGVEDTAPLERHFKMEEARKKASTEEIPWAVAVARKIPFGAGTVFNTLLDREYGKASRRIAEGKAETRPANWLGEIAGAKEVSDYDLVAQYDRMHQIDKERSLVGTVGQTLAGLPALYTEAVAGGNAFRALKAGAQARLGLKATEGLTNAALGRGTANVLARGAGDVAGRTALSPIFYSEEAARNINEGLAKGRDEGEAVARGLGAAFTYGAVQNAVVGQLLKPGNYFKKVGAGMLEQQGLDLLAGASDLKTGYGAAGDLYNGKFGDAGKHLVSQAVTFGVMGGIHGKDGKDLVERLFGQTQKMKADGMSAKESAGVVDQAVQKVEEVFKANPNPTPEQVREVVKDLPADDPLRQVTEVLAESLPKVETPPEAPGSPQTAPEPSGPPEPAKPPEPTPTPAFKVGDTVETRDGIGRVTDVYASGRVRVETRTGTRTISESYHPDYLKPAPEPPKPPAEEPSPENPDALGPFTIRAEDLARLPKAPSPGEPLTSASVEAERRSSRTPPSEAKPAEPVPQNGSNAAILPLADRFKAAQPKVGETNVPPETEALVAEAEALAEKDKKGAIALAQEVTGTKNRSAADAVSDLRSFLVERPELAKQNTEGAGAPKVTSALERMRAAQARKAPAAPRPQPLSETRPTQPATPEGRLTRAMEVFGLDAKEAHVLRERLSGRTHEDIGGDLEGLSRERIRQIETEALEKLGIDKDTLSRAGAGEPLSAAEIEGKIRDQFVKTQREHGKAVRDFAREAEDARRRGEDTEAAERVAGVALPRRQAGAGGEGENGPAAPDVGPGGVGPPAVRRADGAQVAPGNEATPAGAGGAAAGGAQAGARGGAVPGPAEADRPAGSPAAAVGGAAAGNRVTLAQHLIAQEAVDEQDISRTRDAAERAGLEPSAVEAALRAGEEAGRAEAHARTHGGQAPEVGRAAETAGAQTAKPETGFDHAAVERQLGAEPGGAPRAGRLTPREVQERVVDEVFENKDRPPITAQQAGQQPQPTGPEAPGFRQRAAAWLRSAVQGVQNNWRELSGQTAPRTSRLAPESGDAIARLGSATEYAHRATPHLAEQVLGPVREAAIKEAAASGVRFQEERYERAARKLMATAYEERLRFNRDRLTTEATQLARESATLRATDPARARELFNESMAKVQEAREVRTMIGRENTDLNSEADYQRSLTSPDYKSFKERWQQHVAPVMDRLYRNAEGLEATEEIESISQLPDMKFNAKAVREGDANADAGNVVWVGGRQGELKNVQQGKLGFARQFKGAAEGYDIDPQAVIANSLGKSARLAAQADMYRQFVKDGVGVWGKPGDRPATADGTPLRELRGVKPPPRTQEAQQGQTSLFVRPEAYNETIKALDLADPYSKIPGSQTATNVSLMAIVEAFTHAKNLGTFAFKPGVHPLDIIRNFWGVVRGTPEVMNRVVELARIGATKPEGMESAPGAEKAPVTANPISWLKKGREWMSKALDTIDLTMRLSGEQAFDRLAKRESWGVEKTEQNKRDFIGQLGLYQRRVQNDLVRALKDTGLSPFAVAASNYTAQGLRSLVFSPGVTAKTLKGQVALRAEMFARMAAVVSVAPVLNYLLWGRADGDEKTPLFGLKVSDVNGRTGYIDLLNLTGFQRGARSVGLLALAEGKRAGATGPQIAQRATKDVLSSAAHIAEGPAVQFGRIAATGENTMGMHVAPKAKPGNYQLVENMQAAFANANPVVASLGGFDRTSNKPVPWLERISKLFGPAAPKFREKPPGAPLPQRR